MTSHLFMWMSTMTSERILQPLVQYICAKNVKENGLRKAVPYTICLQSFKEFKKNGVRIKLDRIL